MKNIFESILDRVRCCVNCGSLFPQRYQLLCLDCGELANRDLSQKIHRREHVTQTILDIYTLWDWVPGKNDALSQFLISLKGSGIGLGPTWQWLAAQLLAQRQLLGPRTPSDLLFVPAPSTQPGRKDHAYQLAWHLARLTGAECLPCLQKLAGQHQRSLRKLERSHVRIRRSEKISQTDMSQVNIIFVDDVVTTGGTAFASLLALEPIKSMEVWSLAQREPSCGRGDPLL